MKTELSDEALAYGEAARQALGAAGGDGLVQAAEADPAKRAAMVGPVLDALGAGDLRPMDDADELEAAAALCRAAGWWATPYPVAERLARPSGDDTRGLVVVVDHEAAAALEGLDGTWTTVTLVGRRRPATPGPAPATPRKGAFVVPLQLGDDKGSATPADVALGLVLPCWTLLGMLDRAMADTRTYIQERHQFGQPLSGFQGVQFQLTDAEVERIGVEQLAAYALWSLQVGNDEVLDDALALRLAAIEAADVVFRVTHQLHGAMGFCDETPLSWLSRHSGPLRRLPLGLAATRQVLTERLTDHGLVGLFTGPEAAR